MNDIRKNSFENAMLVDIKTNNTTIESFARIFSKNYNMYIINYTKDLSLADGVIAFPSNLLENYLQKYLQANLYQLTDNHNTWLGRSLNEVWRDVQFQNLVPFSGFTNKVNNDVIYSGDIIWSRHEKHERTENFVNQISDVCFKHLNTIRLQSLNVNAVMGTQRNFIYSPVLV